MGLPRDGAAGVGPEERGWSPGLEPGPAEGGSPDWGAEVEKEGEEEPGELRVLFPAPAATLRGRQGRRGVSEARPGGWRQAAGTA